MIKNDIKRATIIGGTGTLGQAILSNLTRRYPEANITVVSRDEHKQALLKKKFPGAHFVIADIRDADSIQPLVGMRDVVFHVAAMKHVDLIEENPLEAIKTNILGTYNVISACERAHVPHMVFSSTDKAVDPINSYGHTKALAENLCYRLNKVQSRTKFSVYRWGNVLGSQGSVIPYFIKTLMKEQKAYITHPNMTRFWIPIEWAVQYMLNTYPTAYTDRAMIPPNMKTALITDVVSVLADMLGVTNYERVITGMRPGEKVHEAMYSAHTKNINADSLTAERYTRDELIEMLAPFVNAARIAA